MSNREFGQVSKLLIDGHDYLSDPNNWTSGRYRTTSGHLWWKKKQYCALGYLVFWGIPGRMTAAFEALDIMDEAARTLKPGFCAIEYNDEFGHEGCMKLYNKAIEIALNRRI